MTATPQRPKGWGRAWWWQGGVRGTGCGVRGAGTVVRVDRFGVRKKVSYLNGTLEKLTNKILAPVGSEMRTFQVLCTLYTILTL